MIADDALRQVFLRRPDTNLLNSTVLRRDASSRRERVVSLELDHGPHSHSHRNQCFLEWFKLGAQDWFNASARFVTRPHRVSERLNDVIGCNADVCGAFIEQLSHRCQHSGNCPKRWISLLESADSVKVAKELVCAVKQVNDHLETMLASVVEIATRRSTIQWKGKK